MLIENFPVQSPGVARKDLLGELKQTNTNYGCVRWKNRPNILPKENNACIAQKPPWYG